MEFVSEVERSVSHHREDGRFIVVYRDSSRLFNNLLTAFIFYHTLNAEASLWDITEKEELLEKKSLKDGD